MGVLDVFDADAFSFVSLTKSVNMMGFVPDQLAQIPMLFEEVPIRTREVWIERRGFNAALIQTTARGTPPKQVGSDIRDARAFNTVRIADTSRVYAHELQNIRRFGSEIDVKDLAEEVARRQYKITSNIDLTEEYHRFNLVTTGKMYDGSGSTGAANLIYDWTAEFGTYPPGTLIKADGSSWTPPTNPGPIGSALSFGLTADGTTPTPFIRANCNKVVRYIHRALQAGNLPTGRAQIVGICGDTFYDYLTINTEVRSTYLNWTAAADLRNSVGEVWRPFQFGGINWINYRGTDDNSTFALSATAASIFPVGAGIFQVARAPAEKLEFVNSPGERRYSWIVRDVQRDMWADVEAYTYPLFVCTLPQALVSVST